MKKNKAYPLYQLEEYESFIEMIVWKAEKLKNKTAFQYVEKGQVCNVSYEQFRKDIVNISTYLIKEYSSDHHIAILGENSYFWLVVFMAIVISGKVAVCLDKELDSSTLSELLNKTDTKACILSDRYKDMVEEIQEKNSAVSFLLMKKMWKKQEMQNSKEIVFETCDNEQSREKTAAIFFTSGTSGDSKAVMLSQFNMMSDINMACKNFKPSGTVLCVLPFHHSFGLITAVLKLYNYEQIVYINSSLRHIRRDLLLARPQTMMLVPLFVDNFYKTIWQKAKTEGKENKLKVGLSISRILLRVGIDVRRRIFRSVLNSFGGELEYIVCGGAVLQTKYIEGFREFGIEILNGYGITECSPVIAVNRNFYHRDGSVGQVLEGCAVRINKENGEIQVKGPNVMLGYYNDPDGTSEVFDNGWFKTGDLGYLDKDNFLYITGRIKNLIILSNGENVSPEELEERILQIDYVKEVVVSEDGGQIQAELYLDREKMASEKIKEDIVAINKSLPNYKKIAKTVIREQEFEKTTTKKIKRNNNI